jgi:hypothetical protein
MGGTLLGVYELNGGNGAALVVWSSSSLLSGDMAPLCPETIIDDADVTCVMHPSTYLNKVVLGCADGSIRIVNFATQKLIYTSKHARGTNCRHVLHRSDTTRRVCLMYQHGRDRCVGPGASNAPHGSLSGARRCDHGVLVSPQVLDSRDGRRGQLTPYVVPRPSGRVARSSPRASRPRAPSDARPFPRTGCLHGWS